MERFCHSWKCTAIHGDVEVISQLSLISVHQAAAEKKKKKKRKCDRMSTCTVAGALVVHCMIAEAACNSS